MTRCNQHDHQAAQTPRLLRVACLLAAIVVLVFVAPIPAALAQTQGELIARGELLLGDLNCIACHRAEPAASTRLQSKIAPDLKEVGDRLSLKSIELFITDPAKFKTGTTMPHLLRGDDEKTIATRRQIAHYLASLRGDKRDAVKPAVKHAGTDPPTDTGQVRGHVPDIDRGRVLYHSLGCVACHSPEKDHRPAYVDESIELAPPKSVSIPIALAQHYDRDSLVAFLLDPLIVRPSGRMPNMKLNADEAADLAAYLQREVKRDPAANPNETAKVDANLIALGKAAFRVHGCANCHGTDEPPAGNSKELTAIPLVNVKPDTPRGCLGKTPSPDAARYAISDDERVAMRAALLNLPKAAPLSAKQRVDRTMTAMNCFACHDRDGKGGLESARAVYFHSTTDALGDEGRIPPPLDRIGAKLTQDWLGRILLAEGGTGEMRPHLVARMPLFGKANIGHLVVDFAEADPVDAKVIIDVTGGLPHHRGFIGRSLMGTGGLNCITCHGLKDHKALGPPAMDLSFTAQRLRPQWFKQMMLDPQVMRRRTIMPAFFPDGKSPVSAMIAGHDAGKQIEQIWIYLKELDQSPLPQGMAAQSFVLKPEEHPIVFRTFMEQAGMQAIAIGFPQGVHAAFDAHQMHWAISWRGDFLDAEATWIDRFTPLTKPLGRDLFKLPPHVPLAVLNSADDAWPKAMGKEAGYAFEGYRFDKARIPTLLYSMGGTRITDRIEPAKDGRSLRRTITIHDPPARLFFRGITGKANAVQAREGVAVIEEVIQW